MPTRVLPLVVALVLAACAGGQGADAVAPSSASAPDGASAGPTAPDDAVLRPSEGFDRAEVVFVGDGRRVAMPVLVADTADLRSTGLMGREDLPDTAGMLFVYGAETEGVFWMKDTLLPLTIAFVGDDGVVQQLTDMDPCRADPCPRYPAAQPFRYAIEANQGYYDRHGITTGWAVEVPDGIGGTS